MQEIPEHERLIAHQSKQAHWKQWGPYLSERAWGTVREDYSEYGAAWDYFPHDHARSRAYRWNEDGLGGICDDRQYLCFALALWNGHDPILKERMFGLTGPQGNHGEDVKEYYFYLDSTPTHSYMKMLYKYPQSAFPYSELVKQGQQRGAFDVEYELLHTGAFDNNRYFDVTMEYAKHSPTDLLIQISIVNRGDMEAECHVLPTAWFRNTWSWGYAAGPMGDVTEKPRIGLAERGSKTTHLNLWHPVLGDYHLYADGAPDTLFTENETNTASLFNLPSQSPYLKDAFHRYLVNREASAVNADNTGRKPPVCTVAPYSRAKPGSFV